MEIQFEFVSRPLIDKQGGWEIDFPGPTHIWKCGRFVAGSTQPSSSNLAVSSCTIRHWGCPVECRPLLEFVTHCELRPDSTLMCSLQKDDDDERQQQRTSNFISTDCSTA